MDIDEPIQQLLNNTGWSCEELLEKLQKYKYQQGNEDVKSRINIENGELHPKAKSKDVHEDKEGAHCNNSMEQISEILNTSSINQHHHVVDVFSDTNEEEIEIPSTHTNTINENIADHCVILSNPITELNHTNDHSLSQNIKEEHQEITEVRVIEVNEDNCEEAPNLSTKYDLFSHNNVEYLETFPRKFFDSAKIIDLTDCDDKDNVDDEMDIQETHKDKKKSMYKQNFDTSSSTSNIKLEMHDISNNTEDHSKHPKKNSPSLYNTQMDTAMIYKKNCEKVLNSVRDDHYISKTDLTESKVILSNINQDQENNLEEELSMTDPDDIRNNLKLQLNSLRTRKKGHFLEQMRTKVIDTPECSTKKIQNDHLNSLKKINKNHNTMCTLKKIESSQNESNQEQDFCTQTNELGLVILSVEGGINLEEKNNEKEVKHGNNQMVDITFEDSSNAMNVTLDNSMDSSNSLQDKDEASEVFDEIRRIIRKQKSSSLKTDEKNLAGTSCQPREIMENISSSFESKDASKQKERSNDNRNASTDNSHLANYQRIDKTSPFISNTLDEFLTENSKLNISYKIPKSGAEEGLTENYPEESPLILKKVVDADKDQIRELNKKEIIKAKTVAQRRKILEKQHLRELKKKAKLTKKETENELVKSDIDTFKQKKRSYIEINDRKLWVRGKGPNICVAKINSVRNQDPPECESYKKKKISLLTELEKKINEKVKYLPGPLSRKATLQANGNDFWETETKVLPKIILEVTPTVGIRLLPSIVSRLPQCDGVITADLAEFALSVLKTKQNKNGNKQTFSFPLKYKNNQKHIMVKRRKVIPLSQPEEQNSEEKNISNVVANVIDNLIRYVEIKEIAPTLVREEKIKCDSNSNHLEMMPAIADNISSIIKKPQKKKSKIELELQRLNCKVVNVEIQENLTEESCNKQYCQLGCICKSLKCDTLISYHCQKVACMFECKCPKEKSVEYEKLTLPSGTDILSKDAVTRIEDEAKKDLAKVEREFTQTVIHTNDKTIVVGTGGRYKSRRFSKAPLKYSDYVDSNFDTINEYQEIKEKNKQDFSRKCFVDLEKLNLHDVEPYCLFHHLYNCHCGGKTLSFDNNALKLTKNILHKYAAEEIPEVKIVDRKCQKKLPIKQVKRHNISPGNSHMLSDEHQERKLASRSETIPKTIPVKQFRSQNVLSSVLYTSDGQEEKKVSTSGRPIRVNRKLREDYISYPTATNVETSCSRVLEVSPSFIQNRKFSKRILNKMTKKDFTNCVTEADILRAKLFSNTPDTLEAERLKMQLALELEEHRNSIYELAENAFKESNHKRKQKLEVRCDDINPKLSFNKDLAIQRRKKAGVATKQQSLVEPVFDGEIIVDKRYMHLLQKMGNRTVMEGYARLLPWKALIDGFNKKEIQIWSMTDQPSRLLVNKKDKTPPKNYIDIRQATQCTEVILWILSNKLPSTYHEDYFSFIFKQTKDNYEICGLCTKNLNENINSQDTVTNETKSSVTTDIESSLAPLFKHRDLNGIQQVMCMSKQKFKLQELVEENLAALGETSIEKSKLYMWASVPEINRMCKWRVIFLNSDFSFLYFSKAEYSIKYTDLLFASNLAKESNCTVFLQSSKICQLNNDSTFGIYFDAHYQDRLFVGPYSKLHTENDIETLRYINKTLVCTESFNKMLGKTDYKCGHWLVERPYEEHGEQPTIDLTKHSSSKGTKRSKEISNSQDVKRFKSAPEEIKVIITPQNDRIKVLQSKPRKPEEFNRYIITNIPHLGYLGAFQHENSSEIDISWPFENKILRFPNVASATSFLQNRFSSLLQPIPEDFKVNILVLTHIDLENSKPIDATILSGHYICGEFGCYSIKTLTNDFCMSKIGTTREELLKLFAKKAQDFVRQKVKELADLINIKKETDIVNILDQARKEIDLLTEKEKQYKLQKDSLLTKKRELALKAFCNISVLPVREKNVESRKFRQILTVPSKPVTETIEISDSDEEQGISNRSNISSSKDSNKFSISNEKIQHDANLVSGNVEPVDIALSSISSPKVNQNIVSAHPSQVRLKSILKSNSGPSAPIVPHEVTSRSLLTCNPIKSSEEPSTSSFTQPKSKSSKINLNMCKTPSPTKPRYLTGVKLIKTCEGKLVLVPDKESVNTRPPNFKSKEGKQFVIRDSKILSIKSFKEQDNGKCMDNLSVSDVIRTSPNKTIILKRDALAKSHQIVLSDEKLTTFSNRSLETISSRKNSLESISTGIIKNVDSELQNNNGTCTHSTIVKKTDAHIVTIDDNDKIASEANNESVFSNTKESEDKCDNNMVNCSATTHSDTFTSPNSTTEVLNINQPSVINNTPLGGIVKSTSLEYKQTLSNDSINDNNIDVFTDIKQHESEHQTEPPECSSQENSLLCNIDETSKFANSFVNKNVILTKGESHISDISNVDNNVKDVALNADRENHSSTQENKTTRLLPEIIDINIEQSIINDKREGNDNSSSHNTEKPFLVNAVSEKLSELNYKTCTENDSNNAATLTQVATAADSLFSPLTKTFNNLEIPEIDNKYINRDMRIDGAISESSSSNSNTNCKPTTLINIFETTTCNKIFKTSSNPIKNINYNTENMCNSSNNETSDVSNKSCSLFNTDDTFSEAKASIHPNNSVKIISECTKEPSSELVNNNFGNITHDLSHYRTEGIKYPSEEPIKKNQNCNHVTQIDSKDFIENYNKMNANQETTNKGTHFTKTEYEKEITSIDNSPPKALLEKQEKILVCDTKDISNVINHESLAQVCNEAIKHGCNKVNMESLKNVNISVSVTISAQIDKNEQIDTTDICSDEKSVKKNVVTKKQLQKENHISKKLKSDINKIEISNSSVNKKKKKSVHRKFPKYVKQLSQNMISSLTHNRNEALRSPQKKNWQREIRNPDNIPCNFRQDETMNIIIDKEGFDATVNTFSQNTIKDIHLTNLKNETYNKHSVDITVKDKIFNNLVDCNYKLINMSKMSTFKNDSDVCCRKMDSGEDMSVIKDSWIYERTEVEYRTQSSSKNVTNSIQNFNTVTTDMAFPMSKILDIKNNDQLELLSSHIKSDSQQKKSELTCSTKEWLKIDSRTNQNNIDLLSEQTIINKLPACKRISNLVVYTLQDKNDSMTIKTDLSTVSQPSEEMKQQSEEKPNCLESDLKDNLESQDEFSNSDIWNQDSDTVPNNNNNSDENKGSLEAQKTVGRTIRCVSAKVNKSFTIDKYSFPKKKPNIQLQSIQKPDKNIGRLRKHIITTDQLFDASKLIINENKWSNHIVDQIFSLAECSESVNSPVLINKERFLKNAEFAEKCINIGNLKKKLRANIGEDQPTSDDK